MAKYRKTVLVEAELYKDGMEDGCVFYDLSGRYICEMTREEMDTKGYPRSDRKPYLKTLEGKLYISEGDYILTGPKGERWACKPDIFAMTYEKVED